MVQGFLPSFIYELFHARPDGNELVVLAQRKMWLVQDVTLATCELRLLDHLKVSEEGWLTSDPQATNYWYMPIPQDGQLVFGKLEPDQEIK